MGNREALTTSSGVLHYLHDAGNRLQEIRQGSDTGPLQASFQYDGNGNMTARLDGSGQTVLTLSYDPKDQLATAEPAGGPENTFSYDPNGYRIEKEDSLGKSRYFLQGEHVEAVYGVHNGQKRATWFRGAVIDEIVNGYVYDGAEAANLTYHHDPLSSVVALTGHTGSVEEYIRYGPFGQVIATTGGTDNLLRYTGRDVDPDTGLYYYGAHYYDPGLGRFLSEDPLGFGSGDVNFYAYVSNNPLLYNDPSGNLACGGLCVGGLIAVGVKVIGGAAVGAGADATIEAGRQVIFEGGINDPGAIGKSAAIGGTVGAASIPGGSLLRRIPGVGKLGSQLLFDVGVETTVQTASSIQQFAADGDFTAEDAALAFTQTAIADTGATRASALRNTKLGVATKAISSLATGIGFKQANEKISELATDNPAPEFPSTQGFEPAQNAYCLKGCL